MYIGSTGSRGLHHLVNENERLCFCSSMLKVRFIFCGSSLIIVFVVVQVYEILDNAVDEAQAGYATNVNVVLHDDNSVSVTDNGRGVCNLLPLWFSMKKFYSVCRPFKYSTTMPSLFVLLSLLIFWRDVVLVWI
jgi:hypothetical protein